MRVPVSPPSTSSAGFPASNSIARCSAALVKNGLDVCQQHLHAERLGQAQIGAGLEGLRVVMLPSTERDDNNCQRFEVPAHRLARLNPPYSRHVQIQQHNVGRRLSHGQQSFLAAGCLPGFVAGQMQGDLDSLTESRLVINYKDCSQQRTPRQVRTGFATIHYNEPALRNDKDRIMDFLRLPENPRSCSLRKVR